ncbi:MAG: hypothetical protein CBC12_07510 [Candidatus Puniceispirillum sp. TMED52]|nr:MAG: hypothetical protein CBC12_07510 [Candidatus Puniceispirillum sp. TMED52]RPF82042.1 MAG: hypothetical protein CBC65_001530 [Rhodothermaceae bacterium TMED105]|tara:strand:- start:1513 stop:2034 length:522 start_codon:yes stop_codon:yes gene_type:complete
MAEIKEKRAKQMILLIGLIRFVHWIIGIVLLATLGGKGYHMLFPIILFCLLTILYYGRHSLIWTTNDFKYTWCIGYLIILAIIPVLSFGGFEKVGSGPIGADLAKKAEKKSKADLAKKAEKNSQAEPSKAGAGVYGETIPYVWWGMITLELVLKIVWFKFYRRYCYPPCLPLY